jgi:hypothetical protein
MCSTTIDGWRNADGRSADIEAERVQVPRGGARCKPPCDRLERRSAFWRRTRVCGRQVRVACGIAIADCIAIKQVYKFNAAMLAAPLFGRRLEGALMRVDPPKWVRWRLPLDGRG